MPHQDADGVCCPLITDINLVTSDILNPRLSKLQKTKPKIPLAGLSILPGDMILRVNIWGGKCTNMNTPGDTSAV